MAGFTFAAREFVALTGGALWWVDRRALLVADLHLEKGSWFALGGQMLPPYDSIATLADLTALATATNAAEIWCLGDSFHDADGCKRLPADAQAKLRTLTAARDFIWVTGNHDAGGLMDICGGRIVEEALVDGIILRHEADPAETRPEMSGHFHPKLRITLHGRNIARRCFVASETKLILPAFGALTGGLDAGHPEIIRAVGLDAQALVPVADKMLSFPIAA
ncbi:MAG: ligase-associated DNA damage response endonuclease PdeM [Sphingomonadales bacterium]